ncbi:hypothetical protein [Arthrobacter sp. ES3-54]|jgi:hypothetical protein|uniref:hypothetical protein n=1 Tax=Arthrobacter sp. ES3-54 TaxID=1502991 RepID=UPI002406084E|nr:hypothetical protein [Arthrobacter sp. ES3-54]MDF9749540.1 hypothetical protein [Arthrobacter sp. ES3-54]
MERTNVKAHGGTEVQRRAVVAGHDGGAVHLTDDQLEGLASGIGRPLLRPGVDGWAAAVMLTTVDPNC